MMCFVCVAVTFIHRWHVLIFYEQKLNQNYELFQAQPAASDSELSLYNKTAFVQ